MSGPQKGGKPPWIDPSRQHAVNWRDGDIVISAPAKTGTNWVMNVVHQLLSGGDTDFASIYDVVPWPEFVERPGQPVSEVVERIDAMPTDRRRAFKSHSAPDELPYFAPGEGKDIKYVVVCRNPEEALVSFKIFLDKHTDAFYELWGAPRQALTRPDFESFYHDVVVGKGMVGMHFGFLASWWPLHDRDNVMMLHFADMKRDLPGSARKLARFLGIEPSEEEWKRIDTHSTFDWMKQNERKFESVSTTPVPVLEAGAMVRKGAVGKAHEDGMTPEIAKHLREIGSGICSDRAALRWLYEGGTP